MTSADDGIVYYEPGRTYASAWALGGLIVAGSVVDAVLGGGGTHLLAWLAALVIVVGADVLMIRAARATRSISVTRTELRVGDEVLDRATIEGIADSDQGRVLGRRRGEPLPRGTVALPLRLAGADPVVVPTRNPEALRSSLEIGDALPEIRLAGVDERADLADLQRRADTVFTVAGIGAVPAATHESPRDPLVVLVAGHPPVGFARLDEVDGNAHLAQLSTLPGSMRRGIGSALLAAACDWASEHGYRAMTLCAFTDVPWNAPLFARRGFAPVAEPTPGLAQWRAREREVGLDALGTRIVMRRELRD